MQWKSRNRGGKVTLSGKGFDRVAAKHYPPNIPNQAQLQQSLSQHLLLDLHLH